MDGSKKIHTTSDIKITNRSSVDISGVDEIFSYDENSIVLSVCGTKTSVEGENLRVTALSVENGRVSAEGIINAVICEENVPAQKGFMSRIFKGKL